MKTYFKIFIALIVCLSAYGCRSRPPVLTFDQFEGRLGPAPSKADAEKAVIAHISATLKDPDSIKQFAITQYPVPIMWHTGIVFGDRWELGYMACFQFNAKNSYGAYAGVERARVALRPWNEGAFVVTSVNWVTVGSSCM